MTIWRRGNHSNDDEEPARPLPPLADECEAYLAGRYGELYPGPTPSVPAWVRLNEVAHASLEDLTSLALSAPTSGVTNWNDARAVLARLLVEAAGGDAPRARRLQIEVLQPLESRLGHVAEFVVPRRLVELVDAGLVGHGRRDPQR
jgi:hypothetical protein